MLNDTPLSLSVGSIPSLQLSGFLGEVQHIWEWVHGLGKVGIGLGVYGFGMGYGLGWGDGLMG